jgi:hypothetical protein
LIIYSRKNSFVKETLSQGWLPIIVAMLGKFKLSHVISLLTRNANNQKVSSISGVILDYAIKVYRIIVIYQPVINGVGGNIVSVYASRLSTALFRTAKPGYFASWAPKKCIYYIKDAFFGKTSNIY